MLNERKWTLSKLLMQDEDQDGDLSRPWSEVVVVTKNLTTFVLKDLPPGQIINEFFPTKKTKPLDGVLPPKTMLHSNPSFSPVCNAAQCTPPRNPLSGFRGNSEKFVAFQPRASAGPALGSEMPGN